MLNTISQYANFQKDVGFLKFKQAVVNNPLWIICFYIHICSIVLCLILGITQFSTKFLEEYPKWHRWLGRFYVYNIVLINFPVCLVLGFFSNGGILGISGFIVQDLLWLYFTVFAVVFIKKKNIEKHRKYMIFSYAITTTALTFRAIKNLFYDDSIFDYTLFYGITVWLALFINLGIAFIIVRTKHNPRQYKALSKTK